MAFTGTPTVTKLGKYTSRITDVSLAAGAAGTIGLDGAGAEASLPADFPTLASSVVDSISSTNYVGLVQVRVNSEVGGGQTDFRVTKTASVVFPITLTNAGAGASGSLEIVVEYLGSQER